MNQAGGETAANQPPNDASLGNNPR
jgi:hypothetical protein